MIADNQNSNMEETPISQTESLGRVNSPPETSTSSYSSSSDWESSDSSSGGEYSTNLYFRMFRVGTSVWLGITIAFTALSVLYIQFLGVFFGGAFASHVVGPRAGAWTAVPCLAFTIQFSAPIVLRQVQIIVSRKATVDLRHERSQEHSTIQQIQSYRVGNMGDV
ncbi:hypothetical protein BGZ63DRAFT_81466 [Mariannaea sp. PMI_226]|nr:hypothetical protein BGZ63DRAFT_81466 [Mariannaea sp. PMI_226]